MKFFFLLFFCVSLQAQGNQPVYNQQPDHSQSNLSLQESVVQGWQNVREFVPQAGSKIGEFGKRTGEGFRNFFYNGFQRIQGQPQTSATTQTSPYDQRPNSGVVIQSTPQPQQYQYAPTLPVQPSESTTETPVTNSPPATPKSSAPSVKPTVKSSTSESSQKNTAAPKVKPSSPPAKVSTPPAKPKSASTKPAVSDSPPEKTSSPSVSSSSKKNQFAKNESSSVKEPTSPNKLPSSSSSGYSKAKKTGVAGRVISPYPPYQELSVAGLPSGSLATDPRSQKIFIVP